MAVASGCGSSASTVPRSFYGIVPFGSLDSRDFMRMASAGVGSIRFQILWPLTQASSAAPFDFTATDQTVAEAARHHMTLTATMVGTPDFANPGCLAPRCAKRIPVGTPAGRVGWQRFLRAAVRRYGPTGSFWSEHPGLPPEPITRWEIWNEQNNPLQGNSPTAYATLLALSDRAIHSVDRRAQIIVGGMFGTPTGSRAAGVSAWSYLNRLYAAGARRHFAAVAVHPYAGNRAGIAFQIRRIRAVLDANGDEGKSILVDEIGWGSGSQENRAAGTGLRGQAIVVSPQEQRQKLRSAFGLLTNHRTRWHIEGIYWFTWKDPFDPPPGLCAFCYSSGLYHSDGTTPKPALSAFESFTDRTGGR